ncbi:hypothetical protein ASF48_04870 [Rathayibacter sp. Leaf299]|uniref:hypothetical protein n=1 Tax=unclassified Rathayibacter TaxID=2609250 RepID=UPI0006F7D29B|nr:MULTISPECIES: hypothetical protein [unclassified Rathayibacter]KQQ22518.1 hypothetical protein ASF48_04870 [Rathayibacter sp. Leaf299]
MTETFRAIPPDMIGEPNGVAGLDADARIPAAQLPAPASSPLSMSMLGLAAVLPKKWSAL